MCLYFNFCPFRNSLTFPLHWHLADTGIFRTLLFTWLWKQYILCILKTPLTHWKLISQKNCFPTCCMNTYSDFKLKLMRVTNTTNQSTKDFYSFQSRPGDSDTHLGRVDSKVLQLTSKPYPPWIPPIMPRVGSLMDCEQFLYYGRLHGVYHITMINFAVCLLRGTTYWKLRVKKSNFGCLTPCWKQGH